MGAKAVSHLNILATLFAIGLAACAVLAHTGRDGPPANLTHRGQDLHATAAVV